ncbi:MAG: transposase [Arsenophonus sp. NEOnobi-MAG3]
MHTYAQQLNQHPHVYLFVTSSNLDIKHAVCCELFFKKRAFEEIWRDALILLLHHIYDLINPSGGDVVLPGLLTYPYQKTLVALSEGTQCRGLLESAFR